MVGELRLINKSASSLWTEEARQRERSEGTRERNLKALSGQRSRRAA